MGLKAVKDAPDQKELDFGPAPEWHDAEINISEIDTDGLGCPPEDDFTVSIATVGITDPVKLSSNPDGAQYPFRIEDGRRRIAAAMKATMVSVPARIMVNANRDLWGPRVTLVSNDKRSSNPVVELDAIEDLMRQRSGLTASGIARQVGIDLKTVKARMKLINVATVLKDAARDGKMSGKVFTALGTVDDDQERRLIQMLEADGKLTMDHIREVKKVTVSSHQRTLPKENWKARAMKGLKEAESEIFLNEGRCDAYLKVQAALQALEEMDD